MPLICYIPVHVSLDGISHEAYVRYDSSHLRKYCTDIWSFVDECFEKFGATNRDEKLNLVHQISTFLTMVSRFWLEKILRPLTDELDVPEMTICYCCRQNGALRRCLHDLIVYSHYDNVSLSKVKVDIFSNPPFFSINVACQEERDIERYKRYYSLMVRRYRELPCCHCCPISKTLVREIEDHIDETERNISMIIDFIVTNDAMLCSDVDETSV